MNQRHENIDARQVTWAITNNASVVKCDRSQAMTKIALMTEPTPRLANTSPSEDASSRNSLRSKTGDAKADPKQEHASEKQNWIQHHAPTRSVKRKSGGGARVAIRNEKAGGDIKFIVHVAAVS